MELSLYSDLILKYNSNSQSARVFTELWVTNNMFFPRCGNIYIKHFENNRPVADFFCPNCLSQYELKSKNGILGEKIVDGSYEKMIKRITSNEKPQFFVMSYSKASMKVLDFFMVPKHFFVPEIIEKRKPLSNKAKRAGWIGCNILFDKIPQQGKIPIILKGIETDKDLVIKKLDETKIFSTESIPLRGWLMEVLNCINYISSDEFSLSDIYKFEDVLSQKYPNNQNIRPKIRQQLQFLRDRGYIEFLENGKYRKLFRR